VSNLKETYKETLTQILAMEVRKKDLSRQILQQREGMERRRTILEFISQDLEKHNLLAQVATEGKSQEEAEVLASICNLYGVESTNDLWNKVESNQRLNQRMLELLTKEINTPGEGDFLERRLLMEIEKQALRLAQEYLNPLHIN